MDEIHATAIVDSSVQIGDNNTVGPFAVLEGDVVIGSGNSIRPHVVVFGPCAIGDDSQVESHAVINTTTYSSDASPLPIRASGSIGSSYGSSIPVKPVISPALALA